MTLYCRANNSTVMCMCRCTQYAFYLLGALGEKISNKGENGSKQAIFPPILWYVGKTKFRDQKRAGTTRVKRTTGGLKRDSPSREGNGCFREPVGHKDPLGLYEDGKPVLATVAGWQASRLSKCVDTLCRFKFFPPTLNPLFLLQDN